MAEHLAAGVQECSNMQEIVQNAIGPGCDSSDIKIKEFEIERERLTSRIDNLRSQNDLLTITLDESRAHADRLTVLLGKYESNNMAVQLALNFADQAQEAYDVLVALLESELSMLLSNCRAAGIGICE